MLHEIYVPQEAATRDSDPTKTVEEKLRIIADAPVQADQQTMTGCLKLRLPYISTGLSAEPAVGDPNTLYIHHVALGDEALYGHGIGTRLLRAAARLALEQNPDMHELLAVHSNLVLVNTFAAAAGPENTTVWLSDRDSYGHGSDKPLEAIFDDQPYIDNQPYHVWEVRAVLNPMQVAAWELPTSIA